MTQLSPPPGDNWDRQLADGRVALVDLGFGVRMILPVAGYARPQRDGAQLSQAPSFTARNANFRRARGLFEFYPHPGDSA